VMVILLVLAPVFVGWVLVFPCWVMICCPRLMMPWWVRWEFRVPTCDWPSLSNTALSCVVVCPMFGAIDPEELCAHSELFSQVQSETNVRPGKTGISGYPSPLAGEHQDTGRLLCPLHEFTYAICRMAPVWSQSRRLSADITVHGFDPREPGAQCPSISKVGSLTCRESRWADSADRGVGQL